MSEPLAPASTPEGGLPAAAVDADAPDSERESASPAQPDADAPDSERESASPAQPFRWKTNLVLFLATVVSVLMAGAVQVEGALPKDPRLLDRLLAAPKGWTFAVPLLAILLTHEFGHYFAARYHKVDASLPFFLPVPLFSPFGTMGAVISMRGRIKSRNALLDIGASGPLAGLVVAIPVLIIGLLRSKVHAIGTGEYFQEGQSLLYVALKRVILGPIPAGHDVFLDPVAMAGWSGLFVTALNLIPVGQLDGGHIAYALFDTRQNRYAKIVHFALLAMFLYNIAVFVVPALRTGGDLGMAASNSTFWLVWFSILHLMRRVTGNNHPPTEAGTLSGWRKVIAVVSLALFVLLFMPTPWAAY
jgi:membrane-associated protease RseP (regulator of RpoE activity)